MILLGTFAGKVFGVSQSTLAIESRFGTAKADSEVIALGYLDSAEERFGVLTKAGACQTYNIFDAFDTDSYEFAKPLQTGTFIPPSLSNSAATAVTADTAGALDLLNLTPDQSHKQFSKKRPFRQIGDQTRQQAALSRKSAVCLRERR